MKVLSLTKTNAHASQIKIFTTEGGGAHTAFVYSGRRIQQNMNDLVCSKRMIYNSSMAL